MSAWVEAGWPVFISFVMLIAGCATLWMQVRLNTRDIRDLSAALKETINAGNVRHEDFVQEVLILKSKMYDEMARLTVSIERLIVTVENIQHWFNKTERK